MKRIVLALFLIWAAPAAGQAAAPPTAAECRQFRADLARERERDYARALLAEGEARFDGHCFPKDSWRGIDLVERAVANGAEDAALWLRHFYEEIDDSASAAKWGRLSAIVLFERHRDRVLDEIDGTPLPIDVLAEWRAILETLASRDVARIVAGLDALAARPPIVRQAESYFWLASISALWGLGGGEWDYAMARREGARRERDEDFGVDLKLLTAASMCNHPRAIVYHAQRYLAGIRIDGTPLTVVRALARINHLTGQYGPLLAEAERKLGELAFGNDAGLARDIAEAEANCRRLSP